MLSSKLKRNVVLSETPSAFGEIACSERSNSPLMVSGSTVSVSGIKIGAVSSASDASVRVATDTGVVSLPPQRNVAEIQ